MVESDANDKLHNYAELRKHFAENKKKKVYIYVCV